MEPEVYEELFRLEDEHWWFLGQRNIVAGLIEKYAGLDSNQTILDVGCGTGGTTHFLSRYGQVYGADYSSLALTFCQQRGLPRLVQTSAAQLPFVSGTFSLVTVLGVLYHRGVEDDLQVLRECYRILSSGGHLLVSEPAYHFLWSEHDVAEHSGRRYTATQLRGRVAAAGFEVEKVSYSNSLLFPGVAIVRLWRRFFSSHDHPQSDVKPLPPFLNHLLAALYSLEAPLVSSRWLELPFGSSVVCMAVKR
ncbi:MAG: class I SAM-dependent methyltransferase [Chloroflexi bacterium]|nr:class I SAM-dependent methyltransferase [Chloroflexota bacterium]